MNEHEKILQKRGRLSLLKEQRHSLRIEIDGVTKAIMDIFDPMDYDCTYADKIDIVRLGIHYADLRKKKQRLDPIVQLINSIEDELEQLGEAIP